MRLRLWDKSAHKLILNLVDEEPQSNSAAAFPAWGCVSWSPDGLRIALSRAAGLRSLWRSAKFSLEYLLIRDLSNCQNCFELWDSGFSSPSDQPASRGMKNCFRVPIAHKFTLCDHKKRQGEEGRESNFTRRKTEWRCLCVTLYLLCCYHCYSDMETQRRQN